MSRPPAPLSLPIAALALGLVLGACAPAAPSPTAPPPKPTEAPKPAPKPTEAPKPAAGPTEAARPALKPTDAPATKPAAKPPEVTVRLGSVGGVSDAGFFIGIEKGYYAEQGIKLDLQRFDSAAQMVAPLSAGQLDVGGGAPSAGLLNANAREIAVKIVADKASCPKGAGYSMVMVRKDLYDSGKVRAARDFKGLKVSIAALGITPEVELHSFLKKDGVSVKDVSLTPMGFPDMVPAFANRAVDAGIVIEPFASRILSQDSGVRLSACDELVPNEQTAVVLYSPRLPREVGNRFMIAYLKGLRDYNDAFVKKDPARRKEVVDILIKHTTVKEPALYERMVMPGLDPNGAINLQSLKEAQDYWLEAGHQKERVELEKVVDPTFAQEAVKALGTYR